MKNLLKVVVGLGVGAAVATTFITVVKAVKESKKEKEVNESEEPSFEEIGEEYMKGCSDELVDKIVMEEGITVQEFIDSKDSSIENPEEDFEAKLSDGICDVENTLIKMQDDIEVLDLLLIISRYDDMIKNGKESNSEKRYSVKSNMLFIVNAIKRRYELINKKPEEKLAADLVMSLMKLVNIIYIEIDKNSIGDEKELPIIVEINKSSLDMLQMELKKNLGIN